MKRTIMTVFLVSILVLCASSGATRLGDFADSIPVGQWTVFPSPTLTSDMIWSPPSGTSLAYNHQAVWDSISNRLMNLGAAHGSGMTKAILYDATTNNWRNILTPREPAVSANRLGHNYDHLTIVPDSGIAYVVTYAVYADMLDSNYFFRYHFDTDKWDTVRARFQNGTAFNQVYVYAGAMEYVPEWHGLAMLSGGYGNRGSFLDLNVATPAWTDFTALSGGYYHAILDYNPVFKKLLSLSADGCRVVDMDKEVTTINQPPFVAESYNTKVVTEPVTGTHLAYYTDERKLFAYEPGQDLWQEVAAGNSSELSALNPEEIIFKIEEYGIVGLITHEPRVLILKYASRADTMMTGLEATVSKSEIEEWQDTTALTVAALRSGGTRDTVTMSCFYTSLDTLVAKVLPGGRVMPVNNSLRGPARIMVTKNTAKGTWRDTVIIDVIRTTAALDSITLDQDSLTLLTGDRFPLVLWAYYHKGAQVILRLMDTADIWSSDNGAVAEAARAQIRAVAPGLTVVRATMAGLEDSVKVRVMAAPTLIKRIDFIGSPPATHVFGWMEDYGTTGYSAARGYGYTDGTPGGWEYNLADANYQPYSNYLVRNVVYPYDRVGLYRVDVPDGEYVVKVCKGPHWAGAWIAYGTDTLLKTADNEPAFSVDTLTAVGGTGLNFRNFGFTAYIIVMSNDGTNFDSVAWDQEPLTFINDSALQALNADTAEWTIEEERLAGNNAGIALEAVPNPFNPSTRIQYDFGKLKNGGLSIFSVKGTLVRGFELNGPTGTLLWNGKDQSGKPLPSGIYFARLSAAKGESRTLKIFYLK